MKCKWMSRTKERLASPLVPHARLVCAVELHTLGAWLEPPVCGVWLRVNAEPVVRTLFLVSEYNRIAFLSNKLLLLAFESIFQNLNSRWLKWARMVGKGPSLFHDLPYLLLFCFLKRIDEAPFCVGALTTCTYSEVCWDSVTESLSSLDITALN